VHVGIRVHFGTGNRDYASCRNSGFTCFSPILPVHPEIIISRSLEGKYTFLGGICWVLAKEVRIRDFRSNLGVLGVPESACRNSCTLRNRIEIMRHAGIRDSPVFTHSTRFTRNHHSRSLEGKYTFLGGIRVLSERSESVILVELDDS